ncbi:MAG: DUF2958 domain-containing protein [Planctomycetota bacterium]
MRHFVKSILTHFVPKRQMQVLRHLLRGEEGEFFRERLAELALVVERMPVVYGQEGLGDKALVHLHYFSPGGDWWITERDTTDEQYQAFGLADLGYAELGYIPIIELLDIPSVEIDLHWQPKPLREVQAARAALAGR